MTKTIELLERLKVQYESHSNFYKDKDRGLMRHYKAKVKEVERLIDIENKN